VTPNWLVVEVQLLSGRDIECDPPPGRVIAVGPSHTFAQLADTIDTIDTAFARWELSHLHEFELPDGRRIGFPDVDPEEHGWEDHDGLRVAAALNPGDDFTYVFDLGDDWRHRCRVLDEQVDPREFFGDGTPAPGPVPIFGWGWIPDQHGRETRDD
jgi:hypothetical protein